MLSVLSLAAVIAAESGAAPEDSSPYAVSEADLFAALDETAYPELVPVRRAWAAGNVDGAKKALATYLRARTSVPWDTKMRLGVQTDPPPWNPRDAEAARRAEVTIVAIPHAFPDGKIDWFYSATGGATGLPANNEWVWQLNRMGWWRDLIAAYQATRDEKWAQAWVSQMRSWVAQCPPPPKVANVARSAWRTIEAGIRMREIWPNAYQTFLHSPSVTDDDLLLLVRTMLAHAKYLSANHTGGNWLTMEMSGLYTVGCLFPERKEATAWRKQAGDALYKELVAQFLPDGAQQELTPGYHNVALDNVLAIYRRAQTVGRIKELPGDYAARAERAFDYNLYLMTPDRSLPKFNDSWPVNVPRQLQGARTLFPARADFAWIATDGKEGKPPAELSHPFPNAGYYVMRDGWGREACMACLDAGPLGAGHFHQDKLNVTAWAFGRELLFDGGGGSYESSPYRSFATDTFGHNCVLVDHKPQRRGPASRTSREPLPHRWESTPAYDFAEGVYNEGWGDVDARIATHTRRLLFVKGTAQTPPLWVVWDVLEPRDEAVHTYEARWHLLTTQTSTETGTRTVVTTDANQPNLLIVPLLADGLEVRTASAQTKPELLGWNVRKDMDPQYVPATTLLHTVQGPGKRQLLTLLFPLQSGKKTTVASVTPEGAQGAKIVLSDGPTLTIRTVGQGITAEVTAPGGRPVRVSAGE